MSFEQYYLSGSFLPVTAEHVATTNRHAEIEQRVLLFETPLDVTQTHGAIGAYLPVRDVLPDYRNAELAHLVNDVYFDLISKTVEIVQGMSPPRHPSEIFSAFYTNGYSPWGIRKTHRFWIAYRYSFDELRDLKVHPDDILKDIVEENAAELLSIKKVKNKAMAEGEAKARKSSNLMDSDLARSFDNCYRMGPFYYDECPVSWTRTCPSADSMKRNLCRFTKINPTKIPSENYLTSLFNVKMRLAASAEFYNVQQVECVSAHYFPDVDDNITLDLHQKVRNADTRTNVYQIIHPEDFQIHSRNKFLFPYITFYHRECVRLRSVKNVNDTGLVNMEDQDDEDNLRMNDETISETAGFNLAYPKHDMYNIQNRDCSSILHLQPNKPQYWETVKYAGKYVVRVRVL